MIGMEDKEWDSRCMNLIGSEHNANVIQVSIIDMWKLGPQSLYFILFYLLTVQGDCDRLLWGIVETRYIFFLYQ